MGRTSRLSSTSLARLIQKQRGLSCRFPRSSWGGVSEPTQPTEAPSLCAFEKTESEEDFRESSAKLSVGSANFGRQKQGQRQIFHGPLSSPETNLQEDAGRCQLNSRVARVCLV